MLRLPVFLIFALLSLRTVADVTIVEPLSFGKIAISDNSIVSTLAISRNNTIQSSNNIHVIIPGEAAEILVDNIGANIALNINATVTNDFAHELGLGGAAFTLNSLDYQPTIITDSFGRKVFRLGASLQTSGLGGSYIDGNHSATITLDITY